MAETNRPEVHLEVCSGFFRIPTEEMIYNITVLPSNESSATKVVEKIVEVEKVVEKEVPAPPPEPAPEPPPAAPEPPPPPRRRWMNFTAMWSIGSMTSWPRWPRA